MTPDEKAELRKVAEELVSAEKGENEQIRYGAFCKFAVVARGATVLALLYENARLAAEVERLKTRLHQHEGHYDAQGLLK